MLQIFYAVVLDAFVEKCVGRGEVVPFLFHAIVEGAKT